MVGFHANYVSECEKFLSEKSYIIDSKNDTEYLGRGMYFWEHKSRAEWWRKSHKKDSDSMIVSAELSLENALDLTDDEIVNEISRMVTYIDKSVIRNKKKERNASSSGNSVGVILDSVLEAFNRDMSKYDIIKAFAKNDKKKENDFFCSSNLTTKPSMILCAKNNAPIGERKRVL